mmetsp:Transcript_1279/g.5104  ORF Transcript_1279/g.5104 Transcript_1279/m.5104 type:complete len:216 (+) Transcript_1279:815-1462(+)
MPVNASGIIRGSTTASLSNALASSRLAISSNVTPSSRSRMSRSRASTRCGSSPEYGATFRSPPPLPPLCAAVTSHPLHCTLPLNTPTPTNGSALATSSAGIIEGTSNTEAPPVVRTVTEVPPPLPPLSPELACTRTCMSCHAPGLSSLSFLSASTLPTRDPAGPRRVSSSHSRCAQSSRRQTNSPPEPRQRHSQHMGEASDPGGVCGTRRRQRNS